MMQMGKHLTFATLADYADGRLAEPARAEADRHLGACAACRADLAGVQRMMAALYAGELAPAPPDTVAQAVKLFRPLARAAAGDKPARPSLLGLLRFDSGANLALGLRSGPGPQRSPRQLLFHVGEYDVDIRIETTGDDWRMAGQLLGSETAGSADLIGSDHRYRSELNELGEFGFDSVAPGIYELLIALPTVDLAIADLPVGG